MREQSKNKLEEIFFKLMYNAIYGKCMQNRRKKKDVKAITKWGGRFGMKAGAAHSNFHGSLILSEVLVLVRINHTIVLMDLPIYVGIAILDISETAMYRLHYDFMKLYVQPTQCLQFPI